MHYKNKSFMTKKKAFTLIELLIVIAIIGILFIVLVSKVDFATDKAKATGVQTDFRSFQVAIESVAKENAGLATFGWDTGDTNGDRIRNSYDKGDINKNGKQDAGEVFIGSKTYGETWTNVYTLTNPADANDKSAIIALEEAINKNLDPKLHITIADDLTITMANSAQDPWNIEYHGYYITNATVDNKDRGAIVMYSNGANQEFGSEHSIANGVVTVTVPGNNIQGKDDYSMAVIYTYVNGYGEVKTNTVGFGNNTVQHDNAGIQTPEGLFLYETYSSPMDVMVPGVVGYFVFLEDGKLLAWLDMGVFFEEDPSSPNDDLLPNDDLILPVEALLSTMRYRFLDDTNVELYYNDTNEVFASGKVDKETGNINAILEGQNFFVQKTRDPYCTDFTNKTYVCHVENYPSFKISSDGRVVDENGNPFVDDPGYRLVNSSLMLEDEVIAVFSMSGNTFFVLGGSVWFVAE